MKASTEQYFPGILFIMLQKVILTLESVDEPLKCVYSSENYWAVLFCGTVYYAAQGGSNLKSMEKILICKCTNETSLAVGSYCTVFFFVFLFVFNI